MAVSGKNRPDPDRVAILRALPLEIKEHLTGEEAEAFMYNLELPDSLLEKLKDYLTDEPPETAGPAASTLMPTKEHHMSEHKPCPTCQGKKIIEGICEVSSEWRGTENGLADDTQCTPDQTCPTCQGKGYEE